MIDGVNKTSLFRRRYEKVGSKYGSIIVKHAQQYFVMIYGLILDMHDGLEVEQEPFMQKSMLDLLFPVHQRMHALAGFLLIGKQVPAPPSCFLRLIHGEVRCRQ